MKQLESCTLNETLRFTRDLDLHDINRRYRVFIVSIIVQV